jgi:hypothetical protein
MTAEEIAHGRDALDLNSLTRLSLTQIVTIGGVVSALGVFATSFFSWCFSRGFFVALDMPAGIVGLRTAIELVPAVAFQFGGGFMIMLLAGYIVLVRVRLSALTNLLMVFCLAVFLGTTFTIGETFQPSNNAYQWILLIAFYIGPFALGYAIAQVGDLVPGVLPGVLHRLVLMLLVMGAFGSYSLEVFYYGDTVARNLANIRSSAERSHPLSATKGSDFPIVALQTTEALNVACPAVIQKNRFLYVSDTHCTLRYITADPGNYYFVIVQGSHLRAFGVSRSIVIEVLFDPPTP